MAYFSELLGRLVADVDGECIGQLEDLIASVRGDMPHPAVIALVVKHRSKELLVPFSAVAVLLAPAISLKCNITGVKPFELTSDSLYLARDVLDKQIIDINGVRVVRVNDLELARVNGGIYVANVDVSSAGLIRRLGLPKFLQSILGQWRRGHAPGSISWDNVELLAGDQPMRLKVPSEKLGELHPADLAEIIGDLSRNESDNLLQKLDIETLADTLEEVEPELQASLVETMPDEKVADVLEEMAPDEAADLLAEIPENRTKELLNLMEHKEAEDLRKLLTYPEDDAGGIMTTDFAVIPPHLTANQAIALLRNTAPEAETIFYVYVTDSAEKLIGVLSLSDLVLAKPNTPVTEFMHRRVVTVHLHDSQEKVAQIISKYNLLAVPVVDDQNKIHGIVTADDALDKIIPTAWKKRIPRLYS
jgi:CBS domain-containing protein/sporulation protein YlmC with PRC-barrel domain